MKCQGPIISRRGFLKVIDCEICDYAHLDPKPTQAALDRLYHREYYQTHNVGWFEKERKEQWYWRRVYRQRLRSGIGPRSDFLDIGAGYGWMVRSAQLDGWNAWGYEPNKDANIKGTLMVTQNLLEDLPSGAFPFFSGVDRIHTSLVLEHILEPLEMLKYTNALLRTNGYLIVIVPNEFNPLQRQLAARTGYSPLHPHHVNYFTLASLRRLVEKSGFEVVRVAATFPMEWFALHGLDYVKHPKFGKLAHWTRMAIEATALTVAPDAWERRRDAWAARGIGREIEIWGRKT